MEVPSEILTLPKVELHEHLDGSLRLETVLDLARKGGIRLPSTDPDTLRSILSPGPSSLDVYLQAFAVTTAVLQTSQSLRRAAFELVEDWARDGLVYGEVRFAPEQHTFQGMRMPEVVEAVLQGLEDGRRAYPVETGLILCSMRHAPPTLATARLVKEYRAHGVVGFDIAGAEEPFPPGLHREAYEFCAENLLATTCHAGEITGPAYIREALIACRSLRIGHGTQLVQEWASADALPDAGSLTRWVLDRGIPLEMCLSSNLQTRACSSLDTHPFARFLRAGLVVTLCTDNRLVSDTSLSKELTLAQIHGNFEMGELRGIQEGALAAAFCSSETKSRIRAKYFS